MASALWSSDRPEFMERIAKLAGGTTYRVPTAGKGTKLDQLPDTHAIATALAFARRGRGDIGPDVAECWVLQTNTHRDRVILRVVQSAVNDQRGRAASDFAMAVGAAWDAMVWNQITPRPQGIPQKAWDVALLFCCKLLHDSAWDTLAAAERAYKRKAA